MKQHIRTKIALLLLCLVLFSWTAGCAGSGGAAVPSKPVAPADPSLWPKIEKDYSASPIMEADPDRDVYIGLANQDCDFYPDAPYNGVFFFMITKDAYSLDEIKVDFPGKTRCKISVREYNTEFQDIARDRETGSYGADGQMPYHYLCLQNVDLQALAQKKSDASYASQAYRALMESNQATEEDFAALMEAYVMPYNDLYEEYIAQYTSQPVGSITNHNAYLVNLNFEPKRYVDETVNYIDVIIGENTYRVAFGQWRFHQENWPTSGEDTPGVLMHSMGVVGVSKDSPYAQGYLCTPQALRFSTTEDIVLTGLRCTEGTNATVLGAKLESTSAETSMDLYWDGSSAYTLKAYTNVTGCVYFYSDIFKEYEMGMTTTVFVDYIVAATGEAHTLAMPCLFPRCNYIWDTYCLAFLGEDIGEYYHYFTGDMLKVFWIRDIPESWRKE